MSDKTGDTFWRYVVTREAVAGVCYKPTVWEYAIREQYTAEAEVLGEADEPSAPVGGTLDELRTDLLRMLKALDGPVVEFNRGELI